MTDRLALALAELADAIRAEVRAEAAPPETPDRLLSVDEAAAMLGIGRSVLYSEIGAGRLRSLRVGRRRLLSASAIRDYIAERAA
jgi:excisionase family DNA binding protein